MSASPVPVVAVPGLGLDARSYARVVDRVPATVRLLPGMGLPVLCPSVDLLARQLLDGIGPGPVVLVGHSQSSQVVAAAAQAGGSRVVAVVLLGPTTDPRLRRLPVLAWRWLWTAVHEPLWQVPLVLAQWWRTGPRCMVRLWRTAAPDRIDRRLARLDVPVTVVRGTRDALCPGDWAAHLAAAARLGRLVELPGAAHMTVQTHAEQVAAIIREAATAATGR
jgi:pimeloyl-ACP methyl ester carboxylesterase